MRRGFWQFGLIIEVKAFISPIDPVPQRFESDLFWCCRSTSALRVNVTVASSASCRGANAQWSYDSTTGMIESGLMSCAAPPEISGGRPWRWGASKLCLALRAEGTFNVAS